MLACLFFVINISKQVSKQVKCCNNSIGMHNNNTYDLLFRSVEYPLAVAVAVASSSSSEIVVIVSSTTVTLTPNSTTTFR